MRITEPLTETCKQLVKLAEEGKLQSLLGVYIIVDDEGEQQYTFGEASGSAHLFLCLGALEYLKTTVLQSYIDSVRDMDGV